MGSCPQNTQWSLNAKSYSATKKVNQLKTLVKSCISNRALFITGASFTAQFRHRNVHTLQKNSMRFRGAWGNWTIKWKSSVLPDFLKRFLYSESLYHLSKCIELKTLHIVCMNCAKHLTLPSALFTTTSSVVSIGAIERNSGRS